MKNVVLYGGAFNPTHISHMAMASCLSNHFDEVWVMPCYSHAFNKVMVNPNQRLAMCQLAMSSLENKKIRVCAFEIHNQCDNTFESIKQLTKIEDHSFAIAIGQDNAATINKWINYQELIATVPFVIVEREGCGEFDSNAWYAKHPHKVIQVKFEGVSSTKIREQLKNGTFPATLTDKVIEYIKKNKLYIEKYFVRDFL